jgi:hypothetical protein
MLEWQAMEELVGLERASKVTEWKQKDHYKEIYAILLGHREQVEGVLNRDRVKW